MRSFHKQSVVCGWCVVLSLSPRIVSVVTTVHVCVCRVLPSDLGIDKVAAAIRRNNIHGIFIVGGFEVSLQAGRCIDCFHCQ